MTRKPTLLELSQFQTVLEAHTWTYAKTMPMMPHFWTAKNSWNSADVYVRTCQFILECGTPEAYLKFPIRPYLYVGHWRYWLMTDNPHESTIINRCDPTHPRYRGKFRKVAV